MLATALVADLVEPFASCIFVPDWQARSARAVAVADYLTILCRDNPFCDEADDPHRRACLSRAPLRQAMHAAFDAAWEVKTVGYDFPHDELLESERTDFERVFSEVDSVEKLAMSACAFALQKFSPPMHTMLALCNVLYDEALHLEAISPLLGINQANEPWISAKRANAWALISASADLPSYLFVEHCLYEGEGSMAAAMGTHKLRALGEQSTAYRVAHKIFCEEVNHALTGYALLKQHDDGLPATFFTTMVRAFVATEGLGDASTFKGRKRRFAVYLASEYAATRSLARLHSIIRANAKAVLDSGLPVVSDGELEDATLKMLT